MNQPHLKTDVTPGRTCPLHYRYSPTSFRRAPHHDLKDLEVLYVVGGLYGNVLSLQAIESIFAQESGHKRMMFNGDFHWFDSQADTFNKIESRVTQYTALRGNVETELASDDSGAGCGCAYPDWVDDGVVERSNQILETLRTCMTPAIKSRLTALPMWEVASVGRQRIGIVHGDAQSLAGWGFAQEYLQDATHRKTVATWFEAAEIDIFSSTHTCLPVMQQIDLTTGKGWVINNGSAGMPNFKGELTGLVTRIATKPYIGSHSRAHVQVEDVFIDLLAIEIDQVAWCEQFEKLWPAGTQAHTSYMKRITLGPNYQATQVVRHF